MTEKILTNRFGIPDSHTIDVYIGTGGYKALEKTLKEMTPEQIIDEVKKSGLRGRGGAGFPTGVKWGFMPKPTPEKPNYLLCNADESEPGTFHDRQLMENDPHQLIEGIIISNYALRVRTAYIYIRGEYAKPAQRLEGALAEAYGHGYLGENILGTDFSTDIYVHRGAGAYICGEETALMESLEGKRGYPRLKPPFPAQYGYMGDPTTINNVQTLSNVPHIILKGADWFRSFGTEKSPGTIICAVSGHVNNPGIFEIPMGTPVKDVIYDLAGGIRNGNKLKFVIPGGTSFKWLKPEKIENATMDHDSIAAAGSTLGSGCLIVADDTTCAVKTAWVVANFYHKESCGQCTPCREGGGWITKILRRIEDGKGQPTDIDLLRDVCNNIEGKCICPLGDASVPWPVQSAITEFLEEFEAHIERQRCVILPVK